MTELQRLLLRENDCMSVVDDKADQKPAAGKHYF
jgi:hypothetical protein